MRKARIVEEMAAYYHVVSRVVGRERLFDAAEERERFTKTMRQVEGFSGVQVLAFAVLGNHFHILLYVPEWQEVDDRQLERRMRFLYPDGRVHEFMAGLAALREAGQNDTAERLKRPYVQRMYNLAEFVKTLKQRVSIGYNRRHNRVGTLWEERYKSVLLDGEVGALKAVAAYIDLNPVRAGLVSDPKDYRFSSYGEAMGGSKLAREGLGQVVGGGESDWTAVSGEYRQLLYIKGESRGITESGSPVRAGYSEEQVKGVMAARGKLPLNEILRCRVRYFTDGVILGSRVFVEDQYRKRRGLFSEKRETGARPMKGAEYGGLCTVRQLRVDVYGYGAPA
jgi:REP element-mobilizing transposase RayT